VTRISLALSLLLIALVAGRADAQLTLRDALARADTNGYANRAAAAVADARAAQALQPYRGILPAIRVEAGYLRTTDPIAAFGMKLRQRAIGAADFDPAVLNHPGAVGDRAAAVVLEQPILNTDAWVGRSAARDASDAQAAAAHWTRDATRVDVVRAYFGATLAAEKHSTLEAAERAAMAHVARAKALADTGMVTRSDALLAEVRAGEVTTRRLSAAGDAAHAARALAMLLGEPANRYSLPTSLPAAAAIRVLVAADTVERPSLAIARADVQAAILALSAAQADVLRAKAAFLPRLNAFARYDWNDPTGLFAGERSWTAGVMASWSPFTGATELAGSRVANAQARTARAQRDAAEANAALELARTRDRLVVTLAQLAIAEQSVTQSAEALRIVARKYDGGLATISDLLEAQAIATQAALGLSFARYELLVAAAELRQARGQDPSFLGALDGATPPDDN